MMKGGIILPQPLQKSLSENKEMLQKLFGPSPDYYAKDLFYGGQHLCVFQLECLAGLEKLWVLLLETLNRNPTQPRTAEELFDSIIEKLPVSNARVCTTQEALSQLTSGATVLLIDGIACGLVIATQSLSFRSVSPPDTEGNIRGSREGFTEILRINISLLRRLLRTDSFCVETMRLGEETKTEVGLFYREDLIPKGLLKKVKKQLQSASLQMLFDTGQLAQAVEQQPRSLFRAVGYTQRPVTAAAKICEGKLVVLVNGSPFAMVVPTFFSEHFTTLDDYTERPYFATLLRFLRYSSFLLAVMLPGVFVAVANFTPELFSPQLLYKIAAAEKATPMPLFMEAVFVNFMLEIVREAGLRMPKSIGHTVSLVAALLIGDTAVRAGILGTPIVVVSALTSLASYAVPSLYEPIIFLRILFILAGGLLGPVGIVALGMIVLFNLNAVYAFGAPYLAPMTPFSHSFLRDGILKRGQSRESKKNFFTIQKLPGAHWRKKE